MNTKRKQGRPFKEVRNKAAVILRYFDPQEFQYSKLAELLGFNGKPDSYKVIQRDAPKYLSPEQYAEFLKKNEVDK